MATYNVRVPMEEYRFAKGMFTTDFYAHYDDSNPIHRKLKVLLYPDYPIALQDKVIIKQHLKKLDVIWKDIYDKDFDNHVFTSVLDNQPEYVKRVYRSVTDTESDFYQMHIIH